MKSTELDWWFGQLAELNQTQIGAAINSERTAKHRLTNMLPVFLVVLPLMVGVFLAVAFRIWGFDWLAWGSLGALGFTYLGIFVSPVIALWVHRRSVKEVLRNPFSILLENAHFTAQVDNQYVDSMLAQPLESIEFILTEAKFAKDFFERRLALIVGVIERIGILPGVLAVIVVMSRLGDTQPDWVYAVAYATPVLYIFGAFAHFLLMRLDRMVRLLELVAEWRKRANE